MESSVQPYLHPNCHRQLEFSKFDLSFYYPPLRKDRGKVDLIRSTIDLFDWDKALCINDVDKKVASLRDILTNIMQNFILNETILYDVRDIPWMTKEIKQLIEQKKLVLQTIHSK